MTAREKLFRIVENAKGDNLERAKAAFRNCTEEEMNSEYGESGQTRHEIVNGYQKERDEWQGAYDLLQTFLEGA